MLSLYRPKVLVIDDEEYITDGCEKVLRRLDLDVYKAHDGESAIKIFENVRPDVVLIDIMLPKMSGINVLENIEAKDSDVIKMIITGYATVELAVEAMKKGAYDFLTKPFTPDQLKHAVKKALDRRFLIIKNKKLKQEQKRIRENLISLVSHELRSPLAVTIQNLDLVLKGLTGEVTEQTKDVIIRCKIRLTEMLDLMNKWFSLATFDVKRLRQGFDFIDLRDLMQKVLERARALANEKNIKIIINHSFQDKLIVYGDKISLMEIFSNLINNAIKYNRDGGIVEVSSLKKDKFIEVAIKDNGIGIPKEYHQKVFEEFFRVNGRKNAPIKGSGLGLAIVKKLVEAHNGQITLDSTPGVGSIFKVILPITNKTKSGEQYDQQ